MNTYLLVGGQQVQLADRTTGVFVAVECVTVAKQPLWRAEPNCRTAKLLDRRVSATYVKSNEDK